MLPFKNLNICVSHGFRVRWRPGGRYFWWHLRSLQETSGYSAAGKPHLTSPLLCSSLLSSLLLKEMFCLLLRPTGRGAFKKKVLRAMLRWVSCLPQVSTFSSMMCLFSSEGVTCVCGQGLCACVYWCAVQLQCNDVMAPSSVALAEEHVWRSEIVAEKV